MNKNFLKIALLAFVLTVTALSVWAGFGAGFGGSSTCCSIHYTVTTQGDWDELFVSMSGSLQATCLNPSGQTARGQRQIRYSQYDELSSSTRERGTNSYEFVFDGPMDPPPSARDAGCPNNNWVVSRLTGNISGILSVQGTNGRVSLFKTSCFYDSAVIGAMPCTISPA
jgi:hypothetical protein